MAAALLHDFSKCCGIEVCVNVCHWVYVGHVNSTYGYG